MDILEAVQRALNSLGYRTDIPTFLAVFGLALARVGTAISLAPFFGGKSLATPVRMALSVMFTAALASNLPLDDAREIGPLLFLALLVKEVAIGLTIGYLAQLIFLAVQMAGAVIDTSRGMDQPGLFAPQLGSNTSALGQLKFQAALVLFLTFNGHLIFLRGLAHSFEQLPVRGFLGVTGGWAGTGEQLARITGQMIAIALQLAAPVLIVLFLVDICFAVMAKVAPQMNVYQESLPVKSFVGLTVLLLAVGFVFVRLEGLLNRFFWDVYRLVAGMA